MTTVERHARKKARQDHNQRILHNLQLDDDLFLDQSIARAEDQKTEIAKNHNNKN